MHHGSSGDSLDLTVAIPVLNEEKMLGNCLTALGKDFARRIVVIDSGSTDQTVAIARQHGAEVVTFAWNGRFPKKRNWFLREHRPETRWILFLDADEWVSPKWKTAVREALRQPGGVVGFWLAYTVHFLGGPLKGGLPLPKLALFQVGAGEYERIDEKHWTGLDMEVHEHPLLNGPTGRIRVPIDHRDDRGLEHSLRKHLEYAHWECARYQAVRKDPKGQPHWTKRQRIKYALLTFPLFPWLVFWMSFLGYGGFRDGRRGWHYATLKAAYFAQIQALIAERKSASTPPAEE